MISINATAGALIALAILGHAAIGRVAAPPVVVNALGWAITIIALIVVLAGVLGR